MTAATSADTAWNVNQYEHFVFLLDDYDVREAKRVLAASPRGVLQFPVELARAYVGARDEIHLLGVRVDWERVSSDDTIDLSVPVIVVPRGGHHMVVDGWHRLARALDTGVTHVPAVLLTEEEVRLICEGRGPARAKRAPGKARRRARA